VNAFIVSLLNFFLLINLGFLSDYGYTKLGHSARGYRLASRWSVAESSEKVSPAWNHYARSRCASRCNDICLDDTIFQPFHFSWFNKSRRYDYGDDFSSRVHGDCGNCSWHLAGCCLASASGYEDLFREKTCHARYNNTMAHGSGHWHLFVSENHSDILVSNMLLFLFLVKNGKFICGLFRELWLPL
jgi:hypothetical protein